MQRKKVLVIRFSSIGDIVLTTPVVRCLKKIQDTEVEVHYATKEAYAGILRNNPNVDMVHCLDGNGLRDLISRLRPEKFDYVIDLHSNIRSRLTRLLLGRSGRSFRKLNFRKMLLTWFKLDRMPDVHIVDRYLAAAQKLGVINDGLGLDYHIPEQQQAFPDLIPAKFRNNFVAFAIGGKHFTKRLPNEKIIRICLILNRPVVLLGGKEDVLNGDVVAHKARPWVFNACGKLSLDQSAYVLTKAESVITHDTGMMHIAAAFQKKVISVWGNTVPSFGMHPYMPENKSRSHIIEVKGLPCRPCSRIGYPKCPKGHFDCMQKIDVERLITILQE